MRAWYTSSPKRFFLYIHGDHLGSTTLVTDSNGIGIENSSYTPFGVILDSDNISRYSYEGKEYDSTIGQYDFNFRGYKAEWGKFTQPDTLIVNVFDPHQLNRYSFERNNPYKYTDPDGHLLVEIGYAALIIWQFGDAVGYASITLGYTYMAIRFQGEGYGGKALSSLQSFGMSIIPQQLVALPKGWVSLPGDWDEFWEDLTETHKENEPENPVNDLCRIIDCPSKMWGKTTTSNGGEGGQDSKSPSTSNPSSQADVAKATSQAIKQAAQQSTGGYVSGVGYVIGNTIYPTSNPTYVPESAGGSGNAGASTCSATGTASCPPE